jgi:hypothetical protein
MGETGVVVTETHQGWFSDPYGRHEDRWFSRGVPTALVRDGGKESQDAPTDGDPAVTWVQAAIPRTLSPRSDQAGSAPGKQSKLRSLWLWFGLAVGGLVLLALGISGTGRVQPAARPMTDSAIALARSTATVADITPALCEGRMGSDNAPDVVADDSDNGRVVTVYEGQLVAISFEDGASMSPPGRTLCFQTDSGTPIGNDDDDILAGDIVYGAVSSGTDFIALHHADGSESEIEFSILPQPPPPGVTASEVALDVFGALALSLGAVGLIWMWHDKRTRARASSIATR